jgi:hypothetical protein
MKHIFSLIPRLFKQTPVEIEEAPRFEEWYNQMFPKDTFNPKMEEFGKTILEFKNEQKRLLTQRNSHSQSL